MKKTNKRMSRVLAVFMSLMLLISSFALPATAALLDNSENDYGISYSDGVYTLNINAGTLSALLKNGNIDKQTLLQMLPEKLADFLVARDAESAMALLKDLYAAADLAQLKNDIPWNVIINEISAKDLVNVIDIEAILDMVDISFLMNAIVAELGGDISSILKDGVSADVDISNITTTEQFMAIIDINKLVSLNAFRNLITSIAPSDLFEAIDKDSLKNGLMTKLYNNFLYTTTIDLNGENIYNGSFNIEAIEYAVLAGIPTPERLANVASDNVVAEFVLSYTVLNPADPADASKAMNYTNGFKVALTGSASDLADIANYGAKLENIMHIDFAYNNSAIETSFVINAPEKLAELYVRSLDTDKLPASIREKLFDIGNIVFDDETIDAAVDALFSKLTIEELRALLQSVEPGNYSEQILAALNMYSSQVNAVLERLIVVLDKVIDQAADNSNLKDKTLAELYLGNGRFVFNTSFNYTVELPSAIPNEISSLFTNLEINNEIDVDFTFNGLHSVKVVDANDNVVYTAFRTEGDSLSFLFTQEAVAALGVTEWANASNVKIDTATLTMGAEDIIIRPYVEGASIFAANFYVDGKLYQTITFDSNIPASLNGAFPNVPVKLAYTFAWDWDYPTTLEARDYDIYGKYTAKTYKATFMYKGEKWATRTYTVETINKVKMPEAPAVRYYTSTWSPATLLLVDSIYEVVTTPTIYYINYTDADGKAIASDVKFTVVDYLNGKISAPEVEKKDGFTWVWDYSPLKNLYESSANSLNCTISGSYVADSDLKTFTVTFYDFNGNVFTTRTFKEGETKLTSIPTAPVMAGYETSWNWDGTLKNDNISVYPAKKAIEYTATFRDAAGETKVTFTIETIGSVKAPEVAAKEGYTGDWGEYTLTTADITINAVYTAIEYTVTFVADGDVVGTVKYTADNKNIAEPEVPAKDGYEGAWEDYELTIGDITVNAIYTEVEGGSLLWLWIVHGVVLVGGAAAAVIVVLKKKKII